jgi:peptidoglycan-associated lipoprotein
MDYRVRYAILGVVLAVGAAGCASKGGPEQPLAPSVPGTDNAQPSGAQTGLGPDGSPLAAEAPRGAPMQRIIYFDYDRSEIRDQDRAALDANGKYLAANPGLKARLEGHADERGSREYNLALGERRAQEVKRYLGILGVSGQQMNTLSYGEEKPVDAGHAETSWQMNRRVEINYSE